MTIIGNVVDDYRWLPNGMNVIVSWAAEQGLDLRARVLANNGSDLTLDTPAATTRSAANVTYQPLSLLSWSCMESRLVRAGPEAGRLLSRSTF